ncbi:hypothetical protein PAHAL_4G173300 [Panicum hallii]|uniref:Uncharacterized protein n=1 Tax=Panicum hallii TaxID=206008 RepID=A0A2T8JD66_9POAL|nr:hypothetical protein PAHAL_4G173300 [Panicum hallii]
MLSSHYTAYYIRCCWKRGLQHSQFIPRFNIVLPIPPVDLLSLACWFKQWRS